MLSTIVYVILFFEATYLIKTMEWMFLIEYIKLKLVGQKIQLRPLLPPRSDGSGIKEEKNCTDKLSQTDKQENVL